jgi:hypothetical protein
MGVIWGLLCLHPNTIEHRYFGSQTKFVRHITFAQFLIIIIIIIIMAPKRTFFFVRHITFAQCKFHHYQPIYSLQNTPRYQFSLKSEIIDNLTILLAAILKMVATQKLP